MKKNFLFLFLPFFLFAAGNELYLNSLKNPFDFTFNGENVGNEPVQNYQSETTVSKVELEVEKVIGALPRYFVVNNCGTDIYGTDYCPEALAKASDKWSYKDGYSVETVVKECSGSKTLNYTTNQCEEIFYANKITTTSEYPASVYTSTDTICGPSGYDGNWINAHPGYARGGTSGCGECSYLDIGASRYTCGVFWYGATRTNYTCTGGGTLFGTLCRVVSITCPDGFSDFGSSTQCKKLEITPLDKDYKFYDYLCADETNSFGNKYIPENSGGDCNPVSLDDLIDTNNDGIGDSCNEPTSPTNNCKSLEYTCSSIYSKPAFVDGEWKCSPFACNEQKQCGYATCNGLNTSNTEIMPYSFHPIESIVKSTDNACTPITCDLEYEYDDGTATLVDVKKCYGDKTYNSTTQKCDGWEYAEKIVTSNSITYNATGSTIYHMFWRQHFNPPVDSGGICNPSTFQNTCEGAYCWCEAVSTTYSCPSGGTLSGTTCLNTVTTSICPSGYSDFGSATQCRKAIETAPDEAYTYYSYECKNEPNSFGNNWELTVDNIAPGCVDDTMGGCISFSKETSVCRRQIHTCPDGRGECIKNSNNQYQCSYDNCENGKMPCISQICDLGTNDKISYCENSQCPQADGIYEKDGKCYILECPDGTYEFNNQCIQG